MPREGWRGDGVGRDKRQRTWYYKFYDHGQLYRQRGFSTQKEARDACYAKRAEIRDHPPAPHCTISFQDAVREYLIYCQPPRLAQATYTKYERVLELMAQRWGESPLGALTAPQIDDYCRWRLDTVLVGRTARRATGATVNKDLFTLSSLLSWAKGRGWVRTNVALEVERFRTPRHQYQPISPQERKQMAEILGPELPKAQLLHCLGVRLGVVLGLKWEQVDFSTHTLTYRSKGQDHTRYLGARAIAILQSLGPRPSGYVFPARWPTNFRRRWWMACKAIGRRIRPHDLRVTFAREMADRGTDITAIRDMLGHKTITMTVHYVGSSRQAQKRAQDEHDAQEGFA